MQTTIRGYYRDTLHIPGQDDIVSDWKLNQIQDNCYTLLASLLAMHNFGSGVGLGINQIAFGAGDPAWFVPSPTPDPGIATPARLNLSEDIFPLVVPPGSGFKILVDSDPDKTLLFGPTVDESFTLERLDYWWRYEIAGIDDTLDARISSLLTGNLTQNHTGGLRVGMDTYFESASLGIFSRLEVVSPIGEAGITSDMLAGLETKIAVGADGDNPYPEESVRDKTSNSLYNEFAVQAITTANMTFVDPDTIDLETGTFATSAVPTNAIAITVLRGPTQESEVHGEFALYGAHSTLTGSRMMVDWVARDNQITKPAIGTLETTVVLHIVEG